MSLIRFSEQFDKTRFERKQRSNYRSNREKSIQMIQQDLNDTENQLKKLEKSNNENKVMIRKHYINEMRKSKIRLFYFFIFPSYLISIVIFAIPFGIIIKSLNRTLLL
ncbi:MAG TPA: hypothetical protein VJ954_10090, partial [Ignavibacteriaceae bacterium]|nr:hypothetical protein [Ignavibacteriaceae bacterium]